MKQKHDKTYSLTLCAVLTTLVIGTSSAESSPELSDIKPLRKGGDLEQIKSQIDEGKKSLENLDEQIEQIEQESLDIQKKLVNVASESQSLEANIAKLQDAIKIAQQQKNETETKLAINYKNSADLIVLLERIKRTPPEALILKPDAPYKTAQATSLLRHLLPYLNDEAENFLNEYSKLEKLQEQLHAQKTENERLLRLQQTEKYKMQKLIKQRKNALSNKKHQIIEQESYIQELAEQAQSVEEFLKKIERGKKERRIRDLAKKTLSLKPPKTSNEPQKAVLTRHTIIKPTKDTTAPRAPVQGVIRINFGEKDIYDAKSEGIKIETSDNALVVTPMSGVVRYAGPFRGYGNLVMIEHAEKYHSLISGMRDINVVVGQSVMIGEPIGHAGDTALKGQPSLYYELRRDGQPTKPSVKISALGS